MAKRKNSENILKPDFQNERGRGYRGGGVSVDVVWDLCNVCEQDISSETKYIHISQLEHQKNLKNYLVDIGVNWVDSNLRKFGVELFTEVVDELIQEINRSDDNRALQRISNMPGMVMSQVYSRSNTPQGQFCKNCECANCLNKKDRVEAFPKRKSSYSNYFK